MKPINIVNKLWGIEEWLVNSPDANYCVKRMTLYPGFRCSQHYHCKKDETFYILEGEVLLHINGVAKKLIVGDYARIRPFDIHYFETANKDKSMFLEASTYHSDDDVVRMTDSVKL